MSRGASREFGGFPTKQVARGWFVGMGGRFCAGSSGIFRQIRLHGDVLSELAGGFVLGALGFSDKSGRQKAFCRNESALLCRELGSFPTKQIARGRFVGIGAGMFIGSSLFFRQNSLRGNALSERAGCCVPRPPEYSDKSGRAGEFCRNTQSVLC